MKIIRYWISENGRRKEIRDRFLTFYYKNNTSTSYFLYKTVESQHISISSTLERGVRTECLKKILIITIIINL